jgi:hypothetical protein
MLLHEKIDALRESQWTELIGMQAKQLELLAGLVEKRGAQDPAPLEGRLPP